MPAINIGEAALPTVALIFGTILIIVAIIRNIVIREASINLSKQQSIAFSIFGALLIVIGVIGFFTPYLQQDGDTTPVPTETQVTPAPTNTFTPSPIPTEAPTVTAGIIQKTPLMPSETQCSITNLGWIEYQTDGLGSTIKVSPILESSCAIKISFDLKANGWVAAYKKLVPDQLKQAQGIRFSYSGTGVANTLEFKLVEKDVSGNETIFYAEWDDATSTAGKIISQDVYYPDLICRPTPGSRCLNGGERFDPGRVDRIDFSFSNKNNTPGQGEVIIDAVQLIP